MKKIALLVAALLASTLSIAGDDVPGTYICRDGQVIGIVVGADEPLVALLPVNVNACKDKEDTNIELAVILMQLKLGLYEIPQSKTEKGI